MKPYIEVRHNIEVAHRLYEMPGKCENIHGHSMWVTLRLFGDLNEEGILVNYYNKPMEFGEVKKGFRSFLDGQFDHHLLLNRNDPFAQPLILRQTWLDTQLENQTDNDFVVLPGLTTVDADPTTENISRWIAEWGRGFYNVQTLTVHVQETAVNAAGIVLGGE